MCLFFSTQCYCKHQSCYFFLEGKDGLVQILQKEAVLMLFDLKLIVL